MDPHPELETSFASGTPRFADSAIARCAAELGPIAAWRTALQRGASEAAAMAQGDFAIALRDASGRAFLAVDRMSVRTLCYRVADGTLYFASRADEVAGARDIDLQALYDYLYFHVIPSPRTIYKGVFRLPPGHYALFEHGRLTVAPYWIPEFKDAAPWSPPTAKVEFRRILSEAVATQLDGTKPACFLSGGTDSSTIAGIIGQVSGRAAATFSIGFDAKGYDEMHFARIAARHFGTEHHEYYVTPSDVALGIPALARNSDQPFGNSSALPAFYCARMARDSGATRLLAGDGGDELFGGNTRYAKQRVFDWYECLPAGLRRKLVEPLFDRSAIADMPLLGKGTSYIRQAKVPMPDRLQTYNLLERVGVEAALTRSFLAAVDRSGPQRQQRDVWEAARTSSLINRMLAYDWRYTLSANDLPKVCGATNLAGVTVGFPFLDPTLLAFSLGMPPQAKLRVLKLRWFFKEAMRGFLPDEILTKKKQGFGLPFGVWAVGHERLHRLASDSLGSLSGRGLLRPQFLKQLLTEFLPSHPGYYGEMVWILVMLEQWLQQHAPDLKVGPERPTSQEVA
jgi:asparagine synthase (glutamine-hydrolysing)